MFAAFTAVTVACQASSSLYIVKQGSAGINAGAGALDLTEVPGVAAAALGVVPPREYSWAGLTAGDLFSRPTATATFIVDGTSELELGAGVPAFLLTHDPISTLSGVRAAVTGDAVAGSSPLASVVSDALGAGGFSVSVSANGALARASGHRDLDTTSREHTVTASAADGSFADSATNADAFKLAKFSPAFLDGAEFAAASSEVTFAGVTFGADDLAFFRELHAMVATADAAGAAAAETPAVLTFTVSTLAPLLLRHGEEAPAAAAAKKALAAVIERVAATLDQAFGSKAVVMAVALGSSNVPDTQAAVRTAAQVDTSGMAKHGKYHYIPGQFDIHAFVAAHETRRSRKSTIDAQTASLAENNYLNISNTTGLTTYCAAYKCQCWKPDFGDSDFGNQLWNINPKDGKVGCLVKNDAGSTTCTVYNDDRSENKSSPCSSICSSSPESCDCNSPTFNASAMYAPALKRFQCTACSDGYFLDQGNCFLNTDFTGVFNGGLAVGLAAVGGLLGTWTMLHNIVDKPPGLALKGGLLQGGAESFAKKGM